MTTTPLTNAYKEDHPLRSGITLLEASAGTGKTYSVTFLYLRLLLEQGLQPSEIVVVTFTRAAAAELRDRIHTRIAHAETTLLKLRKLEDGTVHDDDEEDDSDNTPLDLEDPEVIKLQSMLTRATVEDPLATLQAARALLDTSAISTIHKFAGRLSDEFAMVTGTPSQATLVESLDDQLDDALRDLEHQLAEEFPMECEAIADPKVGFSSTVRQLAKQILEDPDVSLLPEFLLTEIATPAVIAYQAQLEPGAADDGGTIDQKFARLMQSAAKRLLAGEADAITAWFAAIRTAKLMDGRKINARAINSRMGTFIELCQRVARMSDLAQIRDETLHTFRQAEGGGAGLLKYFSFEFLADLHKDFSGHCVAKPEANDIPLFAKDVDQLLPLSSLLELTVYDRIWMQRVAQKVAAMVEERTALAGVRSHAHIISDVVEALDGEHKQTLIDAVSTRYKAALIDEFQDTDLRQWKIFSELFGGEDAITYLIGDPKQAIYGFRGANVAVYERVRDELPRDRVMTLDTNYRSDVEYNEAVNGVFSAANRVAAATLTGTHAEQFVAHYLPVASPNREPTQRMELEALPLASGHEAARRYITNGAGSGTANHTANGALVIRDSQCSSVTEYRDWAASNTAKEIVHLLSANSKSKLHIDAPKEGRPIRPRDCAVIVRSKTEANIVVEALRRAGVPAVARDHQSVATSPAADGLLLWLAAIEQPSRSTNIRAFLCSSLVGMQIEELDEMREQDLSEWTSFFDLLQKSWWKRGLHASLRDTLHRTVVTPKGAIAAAEASNGSGPSPDEIPDDVMSRLLRRDAGSRVAGDLMHLAEILNSAQRAERLTPRGLSDWFSRRRQEEENGGKDERFKRRIESDAEAVEVVTAHSSKGLEYNLVWLVGLTEGEHRVSFLIHPDEETTRYVVDRATYGLLTSFSEQELREAGKTEDTQLSELAAILEIAKELEKSRRASPEFQAAVDYLQSTLEDKYPSLKSELLALPSAKQTPKPFSLHGALEASEHAAVNEDLRLLYVALTRARMRSVVYLGPIKKEAGHLILATRFEPPKAKKKGEEEKSEPTKASRFGHYRLQRREPWPSTSLTIEQWFVDEDSKDVPHHQARDYDEIRATMQPRTAPDVRSTRKNMQSFSSLLHLLPDNFKKYNVSEEPTSEAQEHLSAISDSEGASDAEVSKVLFEDLALFEALDTLVLTEEDALPLATFSSGKEAGTALHAVFEEVDFVGAAEHPITPAFEEQLTLHVTTGLVSNGLDPSEDGEALKQGVLAVLRTPIGGQLGTTRMADISRADRIDELKFFVPMGDGQQGTTAQALFRVLRQRKGDPAIADRWIDDLADGVIQWRELNGLLTGFIDLVFRREIDGVTKYFIADYKSNRIVPGGEAIVPGAFTREAVMNEMAIHHYYLQYHIYLVALHRWLGNRIKDYDYDTHIGGAYYLFVRGMSGADTPLEDGYARGVFFDRPSKQIIDALDQAFERSEQLAADNAQES